MLYTLSIFYIAGLFVGASHRREKKRGRRQKKVMG